MQSALRAQMWVATTRSSKTGVQAGPKGTRSVHFRLVFSCEVTLRCAEMRLEAASTCCLPSRASACRPSTRKAAVGHIQNPAKKGRRVDTPVAKEHGNVPSRAWRVVGLAVSPVLAPSRG